MQLPKQRMGASSTIPRNIILYGLPKCGKTEAVSQLDNCLILDLEKGSEMYDVMRLDIGAMTDIKSTLVALHTEKEARKAAGKTGDDIYPYKYGVIDTVDKLEEYAVISATEKYKSSVIGSKFTGDSVIDLPMGAGWGLVRDELLLRVAQLSEYFRHLIIISHVKDKYLDGKDSKDGNQVSILDLSLSGKLGAILSAKVDAIGYLYRGSKSKDEPYGQLMVSFATNDKSVMGSRYKHLAGKTVPFSWDTIFTPTSPQV